MKKIYCLGILTLILAVFSPTLHAQKTVKYRVDDENNEGLRFGFGVAGSLGLPYAGMAVNGFFNINQKLTLHSSNMYSFWGSKYDTRQGITWRFRRRAIVEEGVRLDVDSKTQYDWANNRKSTTTTYINTDFKVMGYLGLRAGANYRNIREPDPLGFNNDFKIHAGLEFGEQYNQKVSFNGKKDRVTGLNFWYIDLLAGQSQSYVKGETDAQKKYTTPFGWRVGYERFAGLLHLGFSFTSPAYLGFSSLEGHIGLGLCR